MVWEYQVGTFRSARGWGVEPITVQVHASNPTAAHVNKWRILEWRTAAHWGERSALQRCQIRLAAVVL